MNDLYLFLLRNTCSSDNLRLVSAFLIKNENNEKYMILLNKIKEGLIIYDGITTDLDYSSNKINHHGTWKTQMTLYLNMEILFHIAGYNGEYFKQIADDFLSFIREINRTTKYIDLRYFSETKRDVESYFFAAERIVETGKLEDDKPAMKAITNGCRTRSDIAARRTVFFNLLFKTGINLEEKDDFYEEKNYKYNIEDNNSDICRYLNYINILRKGQSSKKFSDVKFLFITANSEILQKAFEIKKDGEFTLASSLDYVIEHFWFILNKGFGTERKIKSFDVIYKARMVLSGLVSDNISKKYYELNQKYADGKLSIDEVQSLVADLRDKGRLPEEINTNEVDFILNLLSHEDIDSALEEKAIKEKQYKQVCEENIQKTTLIEDLTTKNSMKDSELEKLRKENDEFKQKEERKKKLVKRCILFIVSVILIILFFIFFYPLIKALIPKCANGIATVVSILGFFGINISTVIVFFRKLLKILL